MKSAIAGRGRGDVKKKIGAVKLPQVGRGEYKQRETKMLAADKKKRSGAV